MKVKGIVVLLFFSLSLVGCETNSSKSKTYTITWNNDDGTTLEVDENVAYGSMPSYDGVILTKDDNESGYYAISGWSPSVAKVKSNKTYVAQYSFYAYDDFLIYTSNGDETYNVKLKTGTSPIILRIPSTHLDKPITSIPNQAFEFKMNEGYIKETVKKMIDEKSKTADYDEEKFNKKYSSFETKFNKIKKEIEELELSVTDKNQKVSKVKSYIRFLGEQPSMLPVWDKKVWMLLVDKAVVNSDKTISFTFFDGSTIKK